MTETEPKKRSPRRNSIDVAAELEERAAKIRRAPHDKAVGLMLKAHVFVTDAAKLLDGYDNGEAAKTHELAKTIGRTVFELNGKKETANGGVPSP